MQKQFAGWHGTVEELIGTDSNDIASRLESYLQSELGLSSGESQLKAWKESSELLKANLSLIAKDSVAVLKWGVVFEFQLPRERGRRPDVIILLPSTLLVIEFKSTSLIDPAHVDQVACYARDLANYHESSQELNTQAILVVGKNASCPLELPPVIVADRQSLESVLRQYLSRQGKHLETAEWIAGDYAPLPSLVSAARQIFRNEELPQIKRAQSAGIPAALAYLQELVLEAKTKKQRHLVLVTGVPGSGKTLLGLQHVYADHFSEGQASKNAVLLSGNIPLIAVLQDALRSSIFVQDVHGFLQQYSADSPRLPNEHVFVFDEAQRAWDRDKVRERRASGLSEPEDFIRIGENLPDWSVMVGLIGEGQEIYNGEESGLEQWNEALVNSRHDWKLHSPSKIAEIFDGRDLSICDELNLDTSLRSHLASDLHSWVRLMLESNATAASQISRQMKSAGYNLYCSRDLGTASRYVMERYHDELDKRFGFVASSKSSTLLERYGVRVPPVKFFRHGKWYNAEASDTNSSCALKVAASEFNCQGLELDMPIVCWGTDMQWKQESWQSPKPRANTKARDPHRLRLNSYRVLLTRGRDGMVLYVPPEEALDSTFGFLMSCGAAGLE